MIRQTLIRIHQQKKTKYRIEQQIWLKKSNETQQVFLTFTKCKKLTWRRLASPSSHSAFNSQTSLTAGCSMTTLEAEALCPNTDKQSKEQILLLFV